MSFTAMAWASKQKVKTSTQKLVLLMLANYADDEDKCWPSKQTLADTCCMSKAAICNNISKLQEAGFLKVEKREGTSSIIRLNTGVQQEDRGCPPRGQGVSTKKTGGVHHVDTNLSYTLSSEPITEPILVDEGFEEFWQAYPKRSPHPNPKHPAKLKYVNARKVHNVSHETLMTAVKAYAASVAKKDREMIAQAQTWLNQRRWEDDYTGLVSEPKASKPEAPAASDVDLDAIVSKYPGVVSDRAEASKILAAELSKGTELKAISEAVEKYKLYIRQMKQDDVPIAPPILETWLKFKWREMDAYFIYRNPVQRYPVLKPASEKPKWWGKV